MGLKISTGSGTDIQDITRQVQNAVNSSGVKSGLCHIFVPHTTASITINEHADPSVVGDISHHFDALVPQYGNYRHSEGNSPAHIKSTMVGCSLTLLVDSGRLVLGTWQGIFFCEFDGPRSRRVIIKILPD